MKKVYFLCGSDYLSIQDRIDEIKTQVGGCGNLSVVKCTLSKLDEVESYFCEPSTLSLFQNTLFEIVSINLRTFNNLEKRVDEFVNFIKERSLSRFVVVLLHMEKFDKTTSKKVYDSELFKELKNIAVFEEFNKLMPWQLEQIKERVVKVAKKYNLTFNQAALNLYVEHIKENLNNLEIELRSLQLFLIPDTLVNEKCIGDLFYSDLNIDDLFEALIGLKPFSVLGLNRIIDKFDSPLYIIAALQNKLRQLLAAKVYQSSNIGIYQTSKLLGVNSYKLEKDISKASNVSSELLSNLVLQLSDIELKIKKGLVGNKDIIDLILLRRSLVKVA